MANTHLGTRSFSIQLLEVEASTSRTIRRIYVNADILRTSKVAAGDVAALAGFDISREKLHAYSIGTLWPSVNLPPDAILVSNSLLLTSRLRTGQKGRVIPLPATHLPHLPIPSLRDLTEASTVELREIDFSKAESRSSPKRPEKNSTKGDRWLSLLVRETLVDLKFVTPSQTIEITFEGQPRRFNVISVNTVAFSNSTGDPSSLEQSMENLSVNTHNTAWTVGWDTVVTIASQPEEEAIHKLPDPSTLAMAEDAYASVGGLQKQISEIRDLIEIPLTRPELFRHFGLKPPRGVLLHGPPGTGKTHLARAIAASTRSSVIVINGPELSSAYHGETESKLRDVFEEARKTSPCIIVLDEVDALCPRREDGGGGEVDKRVVATLLTLMDGMEDGGDDLLKGPRVVVVATTNRPNAIDPALRRPGRFDREIEIGIPDANARLSILNVMLRKTPHAVSPEDLQSIAGQTHGYVGADLGAVVREAGTRAIKRWLASEPKSIAGSISSAVITAADLLSSLSSVRPSALRSVFLETPQVRWADIGGQEHVKHKLKEAVEWPLLHPETFKRLGVTPPKGVLLYGPPGCSKTLTAKALATESGINFIAVKGPELLNKYVGESERAVREIFGKARAASPCIVFFDEIDALGTSRSEGGSTGSHEGVLTSLLNEMDGIQELLGVIVVAATNRPDVIDPALMRPGRLDKILYVGPPDSQGRQDILRIRTSKMSVDPALDLSELALMTEGCSGAEITSMCQDAALLAMEENIDAPYVSRKHFVAAAKSVRRQITPDVVARFRQWRERSGLSTA